MRAMNWAGLFLACALTAGAGSVPNSFNYQGVLRDGDGKQLPQANKNLQFRLYTEAGSAENTALWGKEYAVILDTNGLFNVELSDEENNGTVLVTGGTFSNVFSHTSVYLGIKVVGSDTEIRPRQKLLSVPFAMVAGDVRSASGDFSVKGHLTIADGVKVTGLLEAKSGLSVGSVNLNSTDNGSLQIPSLDTLNVTGNATVSGTTTLNNGLTVSGTTTLNNGLTVSGTTTLNNDLTVSGTTTLNNDLSAKGPVSVFSRSKLGTSDPTNNWTEVTVKDLGTPIQLVTSAPSDGFIIICTKLHYDMNTSDDHNFFQALIEFSSAGGVVRAIPCGMSLYDTDGAWYEKMDTVTLPVLKGESVDFLVAQWVLRADSNVHLQCFFVPFGVNVNK